MKTKYKVGDRLTATITMIVDEVYDEETNSPRYCMDFEGTEIDYVVMEEDEVSSLFDPQYAERKRQQRIAKLEAELRVLKGE